MAGIPEIIITDAESTPPTVKRGTQGKHKHRGHASVETPEAPSDATPSAAAAPAAAPAAAAASEFEDEEKPTSSGRRRKKQHSQPSLQSMPVETTDAAAPAAANASTPSVESSHDAPRSVLKRREGDNDATALASEPESGDKRRGRAPSEPQVVRPRQLTMRLRGKSKVTEDNDSDSADYASEDENDDDDGEGGTAMKSMAHKDDTSATRSHAKRPAFLPSNSVYSRMNQRTAASTTLTEWRPYVRRRESLVFGRQDPMKIDNKRVKIPVCYLGFQNVYVDVNEPYDAKIKTYAQAYFIEKPNMQTTRLLSGVSGLAQPGQMLLVLGPPGAGKSTLFQVLSGLHYEGQMRGSVTVNGSQLDGNFRRLIGYVAQEDQHIAELTVRETLAFSMRLRLETTTANSDEWLEQVIRIMGLDGCADTIVGNEILRGISGGEKKRLSIAVEFITKKGLMLMDEPTKGLDAAIALDIFKTVRKACDFFGFPVVCSLLQPSPELFELFDKVLVLNDRKMIYFGPRSHAVPYFENLGLRCPPEKNPADFLQEAVVFAEEFQHEVRSDGSPSPTECDDFVRAYKETVYYDDLGLSLWRASEVPPPTAVVLQSKSKFTKPFGVQFPLLLVRAFKTILRNPPLLNARIMQNLLYGVLLGSLFYGLTSDYTVARTRMAFLFLSLSTSMNQAMALIPAMVQSKQIFVHQKRMRYFSSLPYILSSIISDLPFSIIETLIFGIIAFWMVQWPTDPSAGQFFFYLLIVFLNRNTGLAAARMLAAVAPSLGAAMTVAPAVTSMWFLLFSGFIIPRNSMGGWVIWINRINFVAYSYEALSINSNHGQAFTCSPENIVPPAYKYPNGFDGHTVCPTSTGEEFISTMFGLETSIAWMWIDVAIIFGFYLFFSVVGALLLHNAKPPSHRGLTKPDKVRAEEADAAKEKSPTADVSVEVEKARVPPVYLTFSELSYSVTAPVKKAGGGSGGGGGGADGGPPAAVVADDSTPPADGAAPAEEAEAPEEPFHGPPCLEPCVRRPVMGQKMLLDNISGYASPGCLTALMGPSGAGKSTLLDVLAQRKTGGAITGTVLLNGVPLDLKKLEHSAMVGYVEQSDNHIDSYTVRESLLFSANLRLQGTKGYKAEMVESTMFKLGLLGQADQLVKVLSPEQRKRLTIGVELVAMPSLLFLDEPTSGLDSIAAARVMKTVAKLANDGHTIICTIHQPSYEIFREFHKLLLLKKGGQVVYFGATGPACLSYFETFEKVCPVGKNPADFVVDMSGAVQRTPEEKALAPRLAAAYAQSDLCRQVLVDIAVGGRAHKPSESEIAAAAKPPARVSNPLVQYTQLMKRIVIRYWRNPELMRARDTRQIMFGLLLGFLYWKLPANQAGFYNRLSFLYFVTISSALNQIAVMDDMFTFRAVFARERTSGFYNPFNYFITLAQVELPVILSNTVVFVCIAYFMVGLYPSAGQFFILLSYIYMITLVGTSFFQLIASVMPNIGAAQALAPFMIEMFALFAGFIISKTAIPDWWIWMYWLSPLQYALTGMISNELLSIDYSTACAVPPSLEASVAGGGIPVYYNASYFRVYCPIGSKEDIMAAFSIPDFITPSAPVYLAALLGFVLIFRVLSLCATAKVQGVRR